MSLYSTPFSPIANSTATSFNSTLGSSGVYALESTLRVFPYPSGRTIRVGSIAADDFFIKLGSSTIDAVSTDAQLMLGGTVELFRVQPTGQSYIAIKSSTDVIVNITLGTGA